MSEREELEALRRLAELEAREVTSPVESPPSLQERAQETFGFEDFAERGTILPFGITREGATRLATPQIGVDLLQSLLLPRHVAEGGSFTPQDVTRFALDAAVPATARKVTRPQTRRQFVENAPSVEDLKASSTLAVNAAEQSGVTIRPDRFVNFLAEMEAAAVKNGLDTTPGGVGLHPKINAGFNAWAKRIGDDVDMADLQILRRQIGGISRSTAPELADERRIAGQLQDMLDDFVNNLQPGDISSGDASTVGRDLTRHRQLWAQAKKTEAIEEILEKAKTQASGFENGVRVGLRQLLGNKKRIRGFTSEEIVQMKKVVEGTAAANTLRRIAKLGFGTQGNSNIIGGSIGTAGGAALGGPAGAVGVPVVGAAAGRAATASTVNNAELLRAMTATGQRAPRPTGRGLFDLLMRGAFPGVGTLLDAEGNPLAPDQL